MPVLNTAPNFSRERHFPAVSSLSLYSTKLLAYQEKHYQILPYSEKGVVSHTTQKKFPD